MNISEFINAATSGALDGTLKGLWGSAGNGFLRARAEYICALESFSRLYPLCGDIRIFAVPGEIVLTDSRSRTLLSAAASPDAFIIAAEYPDGMIHAADSSGAEAVLSVNGKIKDGSTDALASLAADVFAEFEEKTGFCCYISTSLTGESRRRASAFLLAKAMCEFFGCGDAVKAASAVLDVSERSLSACVSGGFMLRNADGEDERIPFDMDSAGYVLCVTGVGENSGMSADTAEPPSCGSEEIFYSRLNMPSSEKSADTLLDELYLTAEKRRAEAAAEALKIGDTEGFFAVMSELPEKQMPPKSALAYHAALRLLSGCAAVRVLENGAVSAFVPSYSAEEFAAEMSRMFGDCSVCRMRCEGAYEIKL